MGRLCLHRILVPLDFSRNPRLLSWLVRHYLTPSEKLEFLDAVIRPNTCLTPSQPLVVLPGTPRRESRLLVGRMALNDTLRNLLGWTLNHRVGGSSPSQPTYKSCSQA